MRAVFGWGFAASTLSVALAGGTRAHGRDATPDACSLAALASWARPDTLSYVVVSGRPDTIPATLWRPPTIRLGLAPDAPDPPPAPERIVYGQQVDILRAVGPAADALRRFGRRDSVALIAWRHDSMCSQWPPYPTVVLSAGDEAFLATVPRRDHRGRFNTAILDLWPTHRFYDPVIERSYHTRDGKAIRFGPAIMSVAEFEAFYSALPPASLWASNPARALAELERWADEHQGLARREPARRILKEARLATRELRHRDQAHN